MEVIKRGVAPAKREYQVTCKECGTVFRFGKHEASKIVGGLYPCMMKVSCPECGEDNDFNLDNYIGVEECGA